MNEKQLRNLFLGLVGTSLLATACSSAGDDGTGASTEPTEGDGGSGGSATSAGGDGTGGTASGGAAGESTGGSAAGGTSAGGSAAGGSSAGGSAAGGTGPAPHPDATCVPMEDWAGDLSVAASASYRAIVSDDDFSDPVVVSEDGTASADVTAAIPVAGTGHWSTCGQAGCTYYGLVTTADTTVTIDQTRAELLETLGSIDTISEALLVAHFDGYDVYCGGSASARAVDDGYIVIATKMVQDCAPIITMGYELHVAPDGTVTELASWEISRSNACVGRRPEGLQDDTSQRATPAVARYWAETAHLEAASVAAFRTLARELAAHDAPKALIDDAAASAEDEVRHAEVTRGIALKYGAEPALPRVDDHDVRSLEAIALENAVEGCIRETFGALVATYQSCAARDAEVAEAMRTIAQDETRHAALSWRIATWLEDALDATARARLEEAKHRAIAELEREMTLPVDAGLSSSAGLPSAETSAAWIAELRRRLWS